MEPPQAPPPAGGRVASNEGFSCLTTDGPAAAARDGELEDRRRRSMDGAARRHRRPYLPTRKIDAERADQRVYAVKPDCGPPGRSACRYSLCSGNKAQFTQFKQSQLGVFCGLSKTCALVTNGRQRRSP